MADDIIKQIRPHIHEILRIVLDVEGRTLRELNELVGETSRLKLHLNVQAKVIIVQNDHVEIGGGKGEDTSRRFVLNSNTSADLMDLPQRKEPTRGCWARAIELADWRKNRSLRMITLPLTSAHERRACH